MSSRPSDELERLLNGLADGLLSEDEEARLAELLRGDAAARRHYRHFMTLHAGLMWDYAAAATPVGDIQPRTVRSGWRSGFLALAAAVVLVASLATLWLPGRAPRTIAQLEAASGAVSWSDDSGTQVTGLAAGARLAEGTLLVESEGGSAQLRFGDDTRLTLTGEAELGFSDAGQKRLTLRRGALTAQVQPQPHDRPLIIRTATAELEVVGTSFSIAADQGQTALSVEKGNVRLRRLSDGQSVEVQASQSAVASLDVKSELRSARPALAPAKWRRTFQAPPPVNSKGEWLAPTEDAPGRMRAVPMVAGRRPDGTQAIHFAISARATAGEPHGFVTLTDGSALQLRYRVERKTTLKLFLSCVRSGGTFAGNFELALPTPDAAPDAAGWRTLDVPLTGMRPVLPGYPQADGAQVSVLLLHSIESDAGLEVAEFAIHDLPQTNP